MDETSGLDSEHIKQELQILTDKLTQLSKMIECKKILLSGAQIWEAYAESIDAIDQDQRYYL